jgi:hypothetical protein
MTFGCSKCVRQRRLVKRMSGNLPRQLCRRRPIEWAESNARQEIVAFEITQQPFERRIVLLFFDAHGADDETARVRCRPHEVVEPFDRVAVRPLEIIDDENERGRRPE